MLLLGKYIDAENILAELFRETGWSLYYIEKLLLLSFYSNNPSPEERLDSLIQKVPNTDLKFVIELFHTRIKQGLSNQRFHQLVKEEVEDRFNTQGEVKRTLLHFLADPNCLIPAKAASRILCVLNSFSIIDQYLGTLKVIRGILAEGENSAIYADLVTILQQTYHTIRDPHILTLCIELKQKLPWLRNRIGEIAGRIVDVSDLYYKGQFADAAQAAINLIKQKPTTLSCYRFLAKSCIHGETFDITHHFHRASLAFQITNSLIEVYSEQIDPRSSSLPLAILGCRLGENYLGLGLALIAAQYSGITPPGSHIRYVSMYRRSGDILLESELEGSAGTSNESLLIDILPKSLSINLLHSPLNTNISFNEVHPVLKLLRHCHAYAHEGNYSLLLKSSDEGERELNSAPDKRWLRQFRQFRITALLHLNKHQEALFYICQTLCEIPNFRCLFDLEKALIEIADSDFTLAGSLNMLMARCEAAKSDHQKTLALVEFTTHNNTENLQYLLNQCKTRKDQVVQSLLLNHLTTSTLRCSGFESFGNTNPREHILNLRIQICLFLYDSYPEHRSRIITEIVDLIDDNETRRAVSDIEQSKFTLDVNIIKETVLHNYEGQIQSSLSQLNLPVKISNLGEGLVDEIRNVVTLASNEFLLNGFASLSHILSKRLRHIILGEKLRNPFKKNGLALAITTSGEYGRPDFEKLGIGSISQANKQLLTRSIVKMWKRIDNLFLDFEQNRVQLNIPPVRGIIRGGSPNGLFVFENWANPQNLEYFVNNSSGEASKFVDLVFEKLRSSLESSLHNSREYIKKTLFPEIADVLIAFESEYRVSRPQKIGPVAKL